MGKQKINNTIKILAILIVGIFTTSVVTVSIVSANVVTFSNSHYDGVEGIYHVNGTVTNTDNSTMHNMSVMINFNDKLGFVLHQKRIEIGDILPGQEKSFSYDWLVYETEVKVNAKEDIK